MNPIAEPVEIVVVHTDKVQRAYAYLNGRFKALPSRKSLKKAIKAKRLIRLQDATTLEELSLITNGDQIALLPAKPSGEVWHEKVSVVYEDDQLAVVVKVAGLRVSGNGHRTLANALPLNLMPSTCTDAMPRPQPVHRLDKATRGLVICAKTFTAAASISKDFAERRIAKTYRAKVHGRVERGLYINAPIDGKTAETHVAPLKSTQLSEGRYITEVILNPVQGRTHQLRKHLQMVGHPIIGDRLYSFDHHPRGSALQLTAEAIRFKHPASKQQLTIHY